MIDDGVRVSRSRGVRCWRSDAGSNESNESVARPSRVRLVEKFGGGCSPTGSRFGRTIGGVSTSSIGSWYNASRRARDISATVAKRASRRYCDPLRMTSASGRGIPSKSRSSP